MGTYLITGATGGIGSALAEVLQEEGHDLILAGRSHDRLDELIKRLRSPGYGQTISLDPRHLPQGSGELRPLVLDMREPRRMEAALAVADLPDRLDGLVHSAGVSDLGRVAELEADQWIEQLTVNLVAAAELTRLLLPGLRAAGGHVVFVNSGSGLRANPGWSAYAASKHGLRALADAFRAEEPALAVTSVFPGRTATPMQEQVRRQEGGDYDPAVYIQPHTVARVIANTLATPRDAVITDISIRSA
jgi:NADP-dependent 3-hydroxy acid dehydrogenase YdfG